MVLAAAVAVALIVYATVFRGDGNQPTGSAGATSTPASAPSSQPSRSTWPNATGGCGNSVSLPVTTAVPLNRSIGERVLVGGKAFAELTLDTGKRRILARTHHRVQVVALARSGRDGYAVIQSCTGPLATLLRRDDHGVHRVSLSGPIDGMIAGPAGAWGEAEGNNQVLLRPVSGGTLRLPKGVYPIGVTQRAIVGLIYHSDDRKSTLVLIDPKTGKVMRHIAHGVLLAVGSDFVVWTGCGLFEVPQTRCVLHRTDLRHGSTTAYRMPAGRAPGPGSAAVSKDGRLLAFQLMRAHPDTRYVTGHPAPPADVAVLDLKTHALHIVPGLELAPKSGVGLAFSPDGRWLFIAVNEGKFGRVLAWHRTTDRLMRCPGRVPGPITLQVPLLVAYR